MALGVALVGTTLGHAVHIVTDPRIDPITRPSCGAGLHRARGPAMSANGWQSARLERLARIMADNPGAFWPRQYANPDNPAAYRALADELLTDLGHVDVLVGSVGSGGSLCGTARALRSGCRTYGWSGVDCVGSVLFGQPDWPQRLQSGLGNSLHPANLDESVIDEVHWLHDREAFASARELAGEQKIFAGNTSGSVYRVPRELAAHAARAPDSSASSPTGATGTQRALQPGLLGRHGLVEAPSARCRPSRAGRERWCRNWSYAGRPAGSAACRRGGEHDRHRHDRACARRPHGLAAGAS